MRGQLLTALLAVACQSVAAQSEQSKPKYDFSLPCEDRIKLAESAAPPEISDRATVTSSTVLGT